MTPDRTALIAWVKAQREAAYESAAGLTAAGDPEGYADVETEWGDHFDALAALLEAQQWRPITTAPKDGTPVIVYDGRCVGMGRWQLVSGTSTQHPNGSVEHTETYGWFSCYAGLQATHWQPLPPPPTEETPDV